MLVIFDKLGFISNNWESQSQKESLSQRVLDKVKPDVPLKNKIDFAQRKLDFQISKLNTIT